jgi:galactonate dehydratase
MNRREMLTSMGAGMLCLAQEKNPAAQVEDRATAIRISALRAMQAGRKAYVKIETNQKVTGWGEITGLDPKVACALADSLFQLLDGENPTRIEHLWQKLYRAHRDMRGGPFMVHTISAIDMALWDIAGKLHGVPVYRLLGGPTRDKIRMYPHAKAHKTGTGGPHPGSGNPNEVQELVKRVEDTRKKVGPDGTVMFDAHCAVPPPMLIQFANSIQPYDVLFIEEPAVPGNIEVFKRLKATIKVPLATGERDRTIWEVLPYLTERCIDILQPDCCHTGGITQMKKIAVLAEAYQVPIAPHCTASLLGISASLHTACSVPLFLIHEFYPDNLGFGAKGMVQMPFQIDKEGYVTLPPGPGLGVEVNDKALEEAAQKPQTYRWPGAKLKDGSIADY